MQVFLAKLASMVTGKKDGDREAELEAALEAIRMASMEAGMWKHLAGTDRV